jgi:hypothetical protein
MSSDNSVISINCNKISSTIEIAKKYAGSSHSYSLLSLMMLDELNNELNIELIFNDFSSMVDAAEQMIGVWLKCLSNKVRFRSCQMNGVFQKEYEGIKMIERCEIPANLDSFENDYKIVCDIQITDASYTFLLVRKNELVARKMILKIGN